jgi:hypothetical protein
MNRCRRPEWQNGSIAARWSASIIGDSIIKPVAAGAPPNGPIEAARRPTQQMASDREHGIDFRLCPTGLD